MTRKINTHRTTKYTFDTQHIPYNEWDDNGEQVFFCDVCQAKVNLAQVIFGPRGDTYCSADCYRTVMEARSTEE